VSFGNGFVAVRILKKYKQEKRRKERREERKKIAHVHHNNLVLQRIKFWYYVVCFFREFDQGVRTHGSEIDCCSSEARTVCARLSYGVATCGSVQATLDIRSHHSVKRV
jgi:hypothetical protein